MNRVHWVQFRPAWVLIALLGGVGLTSCGAPQLESSSEMQQAVGKSAPAAPAADGAMISTGEATAVVEVPRAMPQLIKTAELSIAVESVKDSITATTAIARQQQGDILGLQDNAPTNSRQTATMQLRVPQNKLETTITALSALGTVQRQAISAEDVSTQLVDFQARLRNLQKTEEMLLGIMERSGNVGDVLKVAQELSTVRNSIEQIDAQLKDLQNRVAYSTINLSFEGAIASTVSERTLGTRLSETWQSSTRSLQELTVDLLQLGIWLMVYSPYLLIIGGGIYGYNRLRPRRAMQGSSPSEVIAPAALKSDES